jgi:hypothetical protein
VFLSQTQVKAIRLKGIAWEDDIDIEKAQGKGDKVDVDNGGDGEGNMEETVNVDQMKICQGKKEEKKAEEVYIIEGELVDITQCNNGGKIVEGTTEEVKVDSGLKKPVIKVQESFKCRESPVVDGKRQSFKLKNIFVNSTRG